MKFSLFLLVILTINFVSCLNKPDHSPLHEYEQAIDSIITGYDSKNIEVYKDAQYRIAESFILYDIMRDSLLSSKNKDYLATKLDQAESTWFKHDNNTFFKTTFITDEGNVVEQVNVQYMKSDTMDSIVMLRIRMPEEVDNIYLTLANWKIDSIYDEYSASAIPLEQGYFICRLEPYDQQMLLERNSLFIGGYTIGNNSPYLHVVIPLNILHEQLSNNKSSISVKKKPSPQK